MGGSGETSAQRIARSVTDLVGDGCVVLGLDAEGRWLRTAAVDHRDAERRDELAALLPEKPSPVVDGWTGQALVKNLAFRLGPAGAADAVFGDGGALLPAAARIRGAVVCPLRTGTSVTGVVVAVRDNVDVPYDLRDQEHVEELATAPAESAPASEPDAARWERVLEHVTAAIWVTDANGATTYANAAACDLVRAPWGRLNGAPLERFLVEDADVANGPAEGGHRDRRLRRLDGSEIWVSVSPMPLVHAGGDRHGTVITLSDVTDRKRVELDLRMRAAAHETLAELAARALAGDSLDAIVDRAVRAAADILDAEFAGLSEVAADGDEVIPRALVGWPAAAIGQRLPLSKRSSVRVALDAEDPVLVTDFEKIDNLELDALGRQAGVRSALLVALGGGSAVLGVASPRARAFSCADRPFLGMLAELVASRWRTSSEVDTVDVSDARSPGRVRA